MLRGGGRRGGGPARGSRSPAPPAARTAATSAGSRRAGRRAARAPAAPAALRRRPRPPAAPPAARGDASARAEPAAGGASLLRLVRFHRRLRDLPVEAGLERLRLLGRQLLAALGFAEHQVLGIAR